MAGGMAAHPVAACGADAVMVGPRADAPVRLWASLTLASLLLTATPATAEAAWVLWVSQYEQTSEWRLHSAYTFRATCLIAGLFVRPTATFRVREGDRRTVTLSGKTWCLPPGVRPE